MPDDDIFDLDALANESAATPFRFRFDGEVYECAPDIDFRVLAALAAGDIYEGLRIMLGEAQWEKLRRSPKTFGSTLFGNTLAAYAKHTGVELPNLEPSTSSSPFTARR